VTFACWKQVHTSARSILCSTSINQNSGYFIQKPVPLNAMLLSFSSYVWVWPIYKTETEVSLVQWMSKGWIGSLKWSHHRNQIGGWVLPMPSIPITVHTARSHHLSYGSCTIPLYKLMPHCGRHCNFFSKPTRTIGRCTLSQAIEIYLFTLCTIYQYPNQR
jgi:hypothetical protein